VHPDPAASPEALRSGPAPDRPLRALPDTGLVRAAAGGWHLVADVGAPCPGQPSGHAPAGTLGCVLHVDGAPLLVDTRTSTDATGPVRSYERLTARHNIAEAAHDGYRRLRGRPAHRRRWLLNGAGLRVDDELTGGGRHTVAVRWHLAPGAHVRLKAGGAVVSTAAGHFPVQISASVPLRISIDSAMVAAGFQTSILAPVLTCLVDSALPIRITTCWRRSLGDAWRA
jgi:uncharacterized heparinase superfamily protein